MGRRGTPAQRRGQATGLLKVEEGPPRASIVLPLYRNAASIEELVRRLAATATEQGYEVIAVDDCGNDGSAELCDQAGRRLGLAVTIVRHSRNLGQNAAVLSGLRAATADKIVVMDADLQDPPEVVPRLLAAIADNAKPVAFGLRTGRWASVPQLLASRIFKGGLFALLGSHLSVRVGLFMAIRREVRDIIVREAEPGDYIVGHVAALRRPAALVPFARVRRDSGKSSYSWMSRARLASRALRWAWKRRRSDS